MACLFSVVLARAKCSGNKQLLKEDIFIFDHHNIFEVSFVRTLLSVANNAGFYRNYAFLL